MILNESEIVCLCPHNNEMTLLRTMTVSGLRRCSFVPLPSRLNELIIIIRFSICSPPIYANWSNLVLFEMQLSMKNYSNRRGKWSSTLSLLQRQQERSRLTSILDSQLQPVLSIPPWTIKINCGASGFIGRISGIHSFPIFTSLWNIFILQEKLWALFFHKKYLWWRITFSEIYQSLQFDLLPSQVVLFCSVQHH